MSSAQYNATPPTIVDGRNTDLQVDSRGALKVTLTAPDTQGTIGSTSTFTDASANNANRIFVQGYQYIFNGTTWDRQTKANVTARLLSAAASTNATSVKASAGNLFTAYGVNTNAAARYLKFYNKASAPTVGTDVPVLTLYMPPSTVNGGQFTFQFGEFGQYFSTGLAYAMTTAAADADTGALTAGDVIAFNITYA